MNTRKFETWQLTPNSIIAAISQHEPENYAELCALVYVVYARSLGKSINIWGDKNNYYIDYLDELLSLFPQARFLHIVRDGRDVACSYREVMSSNIESRYAPQLPTKIVDIAKDWVQKNCAIEQLLVRVTTADKMSIRYEDLVREPKRSLLSIFEWLGLSYESEVTNFFESNRSQKLEPPETIEWKARTLEPVSDATVGRYELVLTQKEKLTFSKIAGALLDTYGYTN